MATRVVLNRQGWAALRAAHPYYRNKSFPFLGLPLRDLYNVFQASELHRLVSPSKAGKLTCTSPDW